MFQTTNQANRNKKNRRHILALSKDLQMFRPSYPVPYWNSWVCVYLRRLGHMINHETLKSPCGQKQNWDVVDANMKA